MTAVSKEGKRLTGLSQIDLRLTEDGQPQVISSFQPQVNVLVSLAVIIDTSYSQHRILPLTKFTAKVFVKGFIRPGKDQASIISFADTVAIEQLSTDDVELLRASIDKLKTVLPADHPNRVIAAGSPLPKGELGTTGLWDTIIFACDKVLSEASEGSRKAIVIFTDGEDTSSKSKIRDAIAKAVKNDVAIYAIGIGGFSEFDLNRGNLQKLSAQTGGRAYFPQKNEELESILSQIELELRAQYVLTFFPNSAKSQGRLLKIEVVNPARKKEKVQLAYRQGY